MPKYNKLVRDRIPEIILQAGKNCRTKILSPEEFREAVDVKLSEELEEYITVHSAEELADLLETVYAAADACGISRDELENIRRNKEKKCGAFVRRLFLIDVSESDT